MLPIELYGKICVVVRGYMLNSCKAAEAICQSSSLVISVVFQQT